MSLLRLTNIILLFQLLCIQKMGVYTIHLTVFPDRKRANFLSACSHHAYLFQLFHLRVSVWEHPRSYSCLCMICWDCIWQTTFSVNCLKSIIWLNTLCMILKGQPMCLKNNNNGVQRPLPLWWCHRPGTDVQLMQENRSVFVNWNHCCSGAIWAFTCIVHNMF